MSKRIYIVAEDEKKRIEDRINFKHKLKQQRRSGKTPERCPSCARTFYPNISIANGHSGYCRKRCAKRGPNYTIRAKERGLPAEVKRERREERRQERKAIPRETKQQYRARALEFFKSDRWQKLRFEAFARYGRQCLCCGRMPPRVILHVDHVKPRMTHPELELDINNLQILCEDCNKGKGATTADFRSNNAL